MVSLAPPAPSTTLRAALYLRVSSQAQGERGYSLEAQEQDDRRLAAELGATVVAVYRDQNSGADWDLPGLTALLDAAKRREWDILIIYDPDRLARNMAKQLVVEDELKRAGVTVRYVTLRLGDTAEDALLKNVRSAIAEYERSKIALRTSRGRRAKAERGEYVGTGRPPYGYCLVRHIDPRTQKPRVVGLEPDPVTAPIACRIFRDAAQFSLYRIARALNAEGIPAPQGAARWDESTLRRMLDNPAYTGTAAYGRRDGADRLTDAATWVYVPVPALVTAAERDAALYGLRMRRYTQRVRRAPEDDAYTLRQALRCGHCGGALACDDAHVDGRTYRYYACSRHFPYRAAAHGMPVCPLPRLAAAPLEADTWARVGEALLDPVQLRAGIIASRAEYDAAAAHWSARRACVEREMTQRRAKLKELLLDRAEAPRGSETRRVLDEAVQETEAMLGRLSAELAKLTPTALPGLTPDAAGALETFAADVRAGLTATTPAEQRRVCRLLQLQGTVRHDPVRGAPLGRHAFTIQWEAAIQFQDNAGRLL
jgi:site-specific DNA recombinase